LGVVEGVSQNFQLIEILERERNIMSKRENANRETVDKFCRHDKDTGSSEVQIALLTDRLSNLSEHFKKHPQDKHSMRGLLGVVSKRKKLIQYLRGEDLPRYRRVISDLGIRK